MKKIVLGAVAIVASLMLAGDANAGCPTPKLFGTFDAGRALYTYVNFAEGGDNASIVGRFWTPGSRTSVNEGTFDDTNWLRQYGTGRWYISGDLATPAVVGCPAGAMTLLLQDSRNGELAVARVAEFPAQGLPFSFATVGGDMTLAATPSPRLTNRVPNATGSSWTVVIDPMTTNFYSDGSSTRDANVTGYQLVQQRRATGAAVDNNAGQWANVGTAVSAAGGSVPVTVDCTAGDQVYLGVKVIFDGGAFASDVISGRANVTCDPNLADPDRKFKVIDRKPSREPLTPRQ